VHAYLDPSMTVVSGIANNQFTVSNADGAKLFVGSIMYIHDDAYTKLSSNVTITKKTVGASTTIQVSKSLGFVPAVGDRIELVGFSDDSSNGYMFS